MANQKQNKKIWLIVIKQSKTFSIFTTTKQAIENNNSKIFNI